jgi:hypothetical protein
MTGTRSLVTSSALGDYPDTNVFSFPSGKQFATSRSDWRPEVEARMQELIRLEEGWDGYRGRAVNFNSAVFAFRVLESACTPDMPAPEIVPGASGDLQLEWHFPTGEIEVHVRAPNDVHAWRLVTRHPSFEEEWILSTDFSLVATWIKELTEASLAPRAAAA